MEPKTLCQITTQVIQEGKMKGGQIFNLMVNSDYFMYAKDECILVLKKMLKEQSNEHVQYEYHAHELIFHTPMILDEQIFENTLIENQHNHD